MSCMFRRRSVIIKQIMNRHFQPKKHSLSLTILRAIHKQTKPDHDSLLRSNTKSTSFYDHTHHHSPLFSNISDQSNNYKIDIIDDETWRVSTGFTDVFKDTTAPSPVTNASSTQLVNAAPRISHDPDFDEIDDLRTRGNLFYKLDRDSKEYEEYNFDFHRRKRNGDWNKNKPKETPNSNQGSGFKILGSKISKNPRKFDEMNKPEGCFTEKKQRFPTFNQLTAPYHEPFCLDIYISKASVRACIVHRATSKVVVVAHSISKDMKFDLGSTKNAAACGAVGKVLAQRALADDIHNVVYTPRKGEKLEGKLKNVVESVMKSGVAVKVKIKQKKARKTSFEYVDYKNGKFVMSSP